MLQAAHGVAGAWGVFGILRASDKFFRCVACLVAGAWSVLGSRAQLTTVADARLAHGASFEICSESSGSER